ncbi:DNA-binding protein [Marinicrinis sediminis]|uniref:DNA-binding protein n=1 Tax=Marinicrinis sediminis TaxID=1652465 RepID=A0ABW5R9X6_9BACL
MDRKTIKRLRDLPDPVTAREIQEFLGISKNSAHNLLNENQFHVLRVGKLKFAPKQSFVKWYLGA